MSSRSSENYFRRPELELPGFADNEVDPLSYYKFRSSFLSVIELSNISENKIKLLLLNPFVTGGNYSSHVYNDVTAINYREKQWPVIKVTSLNTFESRLERVNVPICIVSLVHGLKINGHSR